MVQFSDDIIKKYIESVNVSQPLETDEFGKPFDIPESTDQLVNKLEAIRDSGGELIGSIPSDDKKKAASKSAANDDQQNDRLMQVNRLLKILHFQRDGSLTFESVADVLIETLPMVVINNNGRDTLAVYNPNMHIYTLDADTILNDALVTLYGSSSNQLLSSLTLTLLGKRSHFRFKYRPLPAFKQAVGNGIYNSLTHQLEPFTPKYTVMTKISTDYDPNARQPYFKDFSFQQMINQLADGNPDRVRLLKQICKSIITGQNQSAALFIILGKGGDGKSTFFQMLENVIGTQNTAHINFSDMGKDDKMVESVGKKMVVGLDNDSNIYVRKTAKLKSMASHESITYSRKYLSAISVPFTATIVQLCNDMPRFAETGTSMRRRIVVFKAEHSYTLTNTENSNVDKYIKDPAFLKYVLKTILDDEQFPYYANYNDIDRQVTNDILDEEDVIGQFIDDMDQIHLFDGVNQMIPMTYLYAAYLDWTAANQQSSRPFSARAFNAKITDLMADRGYFRYPNPVRLKAIINQQKFLPSSFDEISGGKHLSETISDQKRITVRVFNKQGPRKVKKNEFRRHDTRISVIDYFGLTPAIRSFALKNNLSDNAADSQKMYASDDLSFIDDRITNEQANDQETQSEGQTQPQLELTDLRTVLQSQTKDDLDNWIMTAQQLKTSSEIVEDLDRAVKQLSQTIPDAKLQSDIISIPKTMADQEKIDLLLEYAERIQEIENKK